MARRRMRINHTPGIKTQALLLSMSSAALFWGSLLTGLLSGCSAEAEFFSGWQAGAGGSVVLIGNGRPDLHWTRTNGELVVRGSSDINLKTLIVSRVQNNLVLDQREVIPDDTGNFEARFQDWPPADEICVEIFCEEL